MTPSGIESATFRLLAQCLNQQRHPVNICTALVNIKWLFTLPTQCIYVFRTVLRVETCYFPIQHKRLFFFYDDFSVYFEVRTDLLKIYLHFRRTLVIPTVHLSSTCLLYLLKLPQPTFTIRTSGDKPRNKCSDLPLSLSFRPEVVNVNSNFNVSRLRIHVCCVSPAFAGCFSWCRLRQCVTIIISLARVALRNKLGKSNHPKGIHYMLTAFCFDVECNLSNWS
jgi:hypothetical protein